MNHWKMHVADSKEEAIEEHEQLTDLIQIYSNGLGHNGQVGTAAVLFHAGQIPRMLHYYLGKEDEHTIFEAEEVGLLLAAHLLAIERDPTFPISISVNNQVSILADLFCSRMHKIACEYDNFNVTLHWVLHHLGVHGNKEVDKHAKQAATSCKNNSPNNHLPKFLHKKPLPLSILAIQQAQHKSTAKHWSHSWHNSP
ncbi:hypothetical protein BDR06DRAFT_968201 [Suillus hirtellus]|nr:hypothetical protein BDR06DRAFT_968201 [Suillus hirtellus]